MADTAHTAWYVGSQNDGLFIIDQPPRPSTDDITAGPAGLNVIAKIYGGPNADRHARLIAAAPDLLGAAKLARATLDRYWVEIGGDGNDALDALRAAIALAEATP